MVFEVLQIQDINSHNFVRLLMLFQVDNELRDVRRVDVEHICFDVLVFLRNKFSLECFIDLFHRRELSIVINRSSASAILINLLNRVTNKSIHLCKNNDLTNAVFN